MSDDSERWTDEDDAAVAAAALPNEHPAIIVDAFRAGLQQIEDPRGQQILEAFVTPESVPQWGDFSAARGWAASDLKISTSVLHAEGAPDVAFIRLVRTEKWIDGSISTPAEAMVTLVWRPEIEVVPGGWRIHAIGEPIVPDNLPRSAEGRRRTL